MHEIWQIDGKEQIKLSDGRKVSWMNCADEASSSHLKAKIYSTRTVANIDLRMATQDINTNFTRWGLPELIKLDNGRPFVNPNALDIPTLAILWWIGLGIKVIRNAPRRPQQNGTVEALQGIMHSWSNPGKCLNEKELQLRIDQESDFQRNFYMIPAKGHETRIKLYPELENNLRKYDPECFNIEIVYQYLARQVWHRTIKKNGEIKFWSNNFYITNRLAGEQCTITFDQIEMRWVFRDQYGRLLKYSSKHIPKENEIKEFALKINRDTTL